ncbi:MAG: 6-bladed beta-propeller [Tannerella sp.]|jgi:hypothetical protein|nr:6-bladed beta-propeller [Tannerella sp.]
MKKIIHLFCIAVSLIACSGQKQVGEYPIIDVVSSVENYKRVYCSDYFSSMELIPLETSDNCIVAGYTRHIGCMILLNNDFIFMEGEKNLYAFDRTGKFLNPVGQIGQGPDEYLYLTDYYFNTDGSTIFINAGDSRRILEYDFNGKYIQSVSIPVVEGIPLTECSYIGNNLFVGQITNSTGKIKNKYCLFDRNGDTVKCFPNYIFFDRVGDYWTGFDRALCPMLIDDHVYVKDYYNDTIYTLVDYTLRPAYVLGLGKYSFFKEAMEGGVPSLYSKVFILQYILGTPNYFFYSIGVPHLFSRPKVKPIFNQWQNKFVTADHEVCGIYDIAANTNILLDTDTYHQRGIINDLNGGLPFFPRYYAGDGVVVDYWTAAEMKEMLTDEYFAAQTITDQAGHQKLKEILINLKDDDNPVIVVAKLK